MAVAALAQAPPAKAPAQTPKAPVSTAKPATPSSAAPSPAVRKPVSTAKPPAATVARMTDDQKVIYALGLLMQRSLGQFDLSAAELDIFKRRAE